MNKKEVRIRRREVPHKVLDVTAKEGGTAQPTVLLISESDTEKNLLVVVQYVDFQSENRPQICGVARFD